MASPIGERIFWGLLRIPLAPLLLLDWWTHRKDPTRCVASGCGLRADVGDLCQFHFDERREPQEDQT
jgi:hypothetical protein